MEVMSFQPFIARTRRGTLAIRVPATEYLPGEIVTFRLEDGRLAYATVQGLGRPWLDTVVENGKPIKLWVCNAYVDEESITVAGTVIGTVKPEPEQPAPEPKPKPAKATRTKATNVAEGQTVKARIGRPRAANRKDA